MGGVKSNIGGLRQGDRLAARWEEPGAVMTANGSQEVSLCYVKKNLASARERRWKSGRRGRDGGDTEVAESEYNTGRYYP